MGVDIVTYRVRVGMFIGGKHVRRKGVSHKMYSPYTNTSDDYVRWFSTLIVVGGIMLCCACIPFDEIHFPNDLITSVDKCSRTNCETLLCRMTSSTTARSYDGAFEKLPSVYSSFAERLLTLAADVESNPGPSPDTQTILDAIAASNIKTSQEISEVKTEVLSMKSEVSTIKSELSSMKTRINDIESVQVRVSEQVRKANDRLDEAEYYRNLVLDDVDALDMKFEWQS